MPGDVFQHGSPPIGAGDAQALGLPIPVDVVRDLEDREGKSEEVQAGWLEYAVYTRKDLFEVGHIEYRGRLIDRSK